MKNWLSLLLVLTLSSGNVFADRIKDLTTVAAMRSNQLIGYGLLDYKAQVMAQTFPSQPKV
jgi:flagellar P-ring protein precursor FlgI